MYKFGLIGYPLSHSMSRVIHEAAFKSLGVEGTYELLETEQEEFVPRIKQLKNGDYQGFNVTIPFKVPVTLFLSGVDNVANIAGSVNTIKVKEDGSLFGYNTDVFGFVEAMDKECKNSLNGSKVAVLGNGGAARAVAVGLGILNVEKIDFYVRNIINASEMIDVLKKSFPKTVMNCIQIDVLNDLSQYKMLVNTTPIGMRSKAMGISPIDEKIVKTLNNQAYVYDIVYNPLNTELIKIAQKNGIKTIKGLDMLVYQGAKAFEIWTGKKPDVLKMKIAALEEMVQ